jgi:hypothetical protein
VWFTQNSTGRSPRTCSSSAPRARVLTGRRAAVILGRGPACRLSRARLASSGFRRRHTCPPRSRRHRGTRETYSMEGLGRTIRQCLQNPHFTHVARRSRVHDSHGQRTVKLACNVHGRARAERRPTQLGTDRARSSAKMRSNARAQGSRPRHQAGVCVARGVDPSGVCDRQVREGRLCMLRGRTSRAAARKRGHCAGAGLCDDARKELGRKRAGPKRCRCRSCLERLLGNTLVASMYYPDVAAR